MGRADTAPGVAEVNLAQAFHNQAQSDFAIFGFLRDHGPPGMPECHPLHYLQMTVEKLSKAFVAAQGSEPPRSHEVFSRLLEMTGTRRYAEKLGYPNYRAYRGMLEGLIPLARRVEELHPQVPRVPPGLEKSNVEYPWRARGDGNGEEWWSPATYAFGVLDALRSPRGLQLLNHVRLLLVRFSEASRS